MGHTNQTKQDGHDFVIIDNDIEAHISQEITTLPTSAETVTQDFKDLGAAVLSLAEAAITFVYSKTEECFYTKPKANANSLDTERKTHIKQRCVLS